MAEALQRAVDALPQGPTRRRLESDLVTYAALLRDALGVTTGGASRDAARVDVASSLATAEASIRAACVPPGGASFALPDLQADGRPWSAAVAAVGAALHALVATPGQSAADEHWQSLAGLLHRMGGCAAASFPGSHCAASVVLLRHVARTSAPTAALVAGSPATDAVACCVADDGTLAAFLAGKTVGSVSDGRGDNAAPALDNLWRLAHAKAADVPLLLAAVGCGAETHTRAHGDVYLSVAACARTAMRLMRESRDVVGATDVLSRVAAAWPTPGALVCALPGGARAVSADGRAISVELMGVASEADFEGVIQSWRATRIAAASQDAQAGEATAAAVAADDEDLFFFDTAPRDDGEHGEDLDAWMGQQDGPPPAPEDADEGEDEP